MRLKSLAYATCKHLKLLPILRLCQTLFPCPKTFNKKDTCENMFAFRETGLLLEKLPRLKYKIEPLKPCKTLSSKK